MCCAKTATAIRQWWLLSLQVLSQILGCNLGWCEVFWASFGLVLWGDWAAFLNKHLATLNYSVKAAKGGSQYLCLNGNISLLRHMQFCRTHTYAILSYSHICNSVDICNSVVHHWRDLEAALGKIAMKMCGLQQDFVTWNICQEASAAVACRGRRANGAMAPGIQGRGHPMSKIYKI